MYTEQTNNSVLYDISSKDTFFLNINSYSHDRWLDCTC